MQLEKLLGSRNKITLLRHLSKKEGWLFNLSLAGKEINLDKGVVSKLIKDLEENKIVEVKRSGKLILFRLNKKYSHILKKIFEAEKRHG